MINLVSGVLKNLQVEVTFDTKKALVEVNEKEVRCWLDMTPVDENGVVIPGSRQSHVNVSYNIAEAAFSTNMNNISDTAAGNAMQEAIIAKINEVFAELKAIGS
jgi:hypothetical protein